MRGGNKMPNIVFEHREFFSHKKDQLGAIGIRGEMGYDADNQPLFDCAIQMGDCFRTITVPLIAHDEQTSLEALKKIELILNIATIAKTHLQAFHKAITT